MVKLRFVARPRLWKIRKVRNGREAVYDRVIIYVPREIAKFIDLGKEYVVVVEEVGGDG